MSRTQKNSPSAQDRMRALSGRFKEQQRRVVAPLRRGVFLAPATITSLGLLSGFFALVSAINSHFELAAVMILIAFVCDGLDGRVARLSRTSSHFGIEYDSLSDVVAFGVAPAVTAYCWSLRLLGAWGVVIAGMFVICAALRLARFNVQTGSTDKRRFVGLPVPGAADVLIDRESPLVAALDPSDPPRANWNTDATPPEWSIVTEGRSGSIDLSAKELLLLGPLLVSLLALGIWPQAISAALRFALAGLSLSP